MKELKKKYVCLYCKAGGYYCLHCDGHKIKVSKDKIYFEIIDYAM